MPTPTPTPPGDRPTVDWRDRGPFNPTYPNPPIDTYRARIATLTVENHHLAALLDGVLADDPQAIRDAALWLTVNRPEVDGGIARRIAGRDRALVSVDDAIAHALSLQWIEGNDDVGFRAGDAQPS